VGWANDPKFDHTAFERVYARTGGIPRRINVLCSRILLWAFLEETHETSGKIVDEIADDLAREQMTVDAPYGPGRKISLRVEDLDETTVLCVSHFIAKEVHASFPKINIEIDGVAGGDLRMRIVENQEIDENELKEINLCLELTVQRLRNSQDELMRIKRLNERAALRLVRGGEPDDRVEAAIVYLDIEGYSSIDSPAKVELADFLWKAAKCVTTREKVYVSNTWGDAAIVGFQSINSALESAFTFCNLTRALDAVDA
jgi:hypothetical protein